ncbi:MAG TPA: EAL domain-containing protein [Candidatus Acidoferrales bacterium]|nr:EAL domain-containing protein [Candidatus Acidoferrales bacterium]
MSSPLRLLLIEDVATDAELVCHELRKAKIDFRWRRVETKEAFLNELEAFAPHAILADYHLPRFNAMEALRLLKQRKLDIPFILVTGSQSEEVAVECMREGADDYILKTSLKRLPSALLNALRKHEAEQEKERAEAELRRREEQYRLITENTQDLICMLDPAGTLTYVSPSARALLGYESQSLVGTSCLELIHPEDRKAAGAALEQLFASPDGGAQEFRLRRAGGDWRIFESIGSRILDDTGKAQRLVLVARDVTERKRDEEMIRHLAYYDALTGLPNRTLFNDRLAQALAQAYRSRQMIALMFLDLDRLKAVNDTLGHAMGDRLLQAVSERLKGCLREGDTIARLGGDEFLLLLQGVAHLEDVAKVARRLLDALKPSFYCEGQELHTTASIGIAIYPNDSKDADSLMRNADTAMYRAKELGRNNYQFYSASMNESALQRLSLENSLRRALQRQEFVLHYQPQMSLATGEITGGEALIRWNHPELGMVPPVRFIPIAEESGLILPVGEWVLATASAQNKAWQKAGLKPLRVAVNLSPLHFKHKDLAETIARILEKTELDARYLELEVTESVIMQTSELDSDAIVGTMLKLKETGIHVSIDDFGTGYSSLSYLKRFPVDTVKIDQSFIRDITTNPDDAAIARAIISIAHSLGLRVIAEGVETREQLDFLSAEKCDEVQGFFLSRALPADDFFDFVQAHERRLAKCTD